MLMFMGCSKLNDEDNMCMVFKHYAYVSTVQEFSLG